MNDTTPATIAEIRARYEEIAPGPTSDTPDPAVALARWLTFAVQRGFTRMLSPDLPMNHDEMLLMLARFEGLHLLASKLGGDRAGADRLSREMLDAAEDGGGIGEWVYEHGQAFGIDTGEIGRLADAEAALEAGLRKSGASVSPDLSCKQCGDGGPFAESARDALDAQTLHDSPGADPDDESREDEAFAADAASLDSDFEDDPWDNSGRAATQDIL